ncbi:unnamed protein product [Cyclocybe aegerita]|uniref:Uncharacterized protein n=1 Tax=Cyclocybe aegerita TaxID=1973307 RepID=A0A8S0X3B4_CYCAE|nr:unnamed protein product [Cyclocybe aegerita]
MEHVSSKNDASPMTTKMSDESELDMLQVYPHEEQALRWKFDLYLLPPLAFMYLCNALDKGNVGNAKTDGWDKDIGLTGNQVLTHRELPVHMLEGVANNHGGNSTIFSS